MQPALEDAMRELAVITAAARPTAVLRADGPRVVVLPGVPAAGLLSRMSKRAVGPVVAAAAGAPPHLELKHAEVVRRVRVGVGVGVGVLATAVERQELPERGLGDPRRVVGEHIGAIKSRSRRRLGRGGPAAEELPWGNVECLLGGEELVGGVELMLLCTNAAHVWGRRKLARDLRVKKELDLREIMDEVEHEGCVLKKKDARSGHLYRVV